MKDTDIIAAIAPDAVSLMDKAIAEIKRLRQENATLTAERDALFVLTDRLTAEHDALRAERDEARREVCYLRPTVCLGAQSADGYAMARGWDCFKEGT